MYIHCGDKFTMLLAHTKESNEKSDIPLSSWTADITRSQHFAKLPKDVDGVLRFSEFVNLEGSSEFFNQTDNYVKMLSEKNGENEGSSTALFKTKNIPRLNLLSILLYSMAVASFRYSKPSEKASLVDGILTSVQDVDIFTLNEGHRRVIKAFSADSKEAVQLPPNLTDREYATENCDSTLGNLSRLIEYLFILYSSNLDALINNKSELAVKYPLLGDDEKLAATISEGDNAQLEESVDSVGSAQLQFGKEVTEEELAKSKEDLLQDLQVHVEISGARINTSFEMLYCAIIIFAANVEVLSKAQQSKESLNGIQELTASMVKKNIRKDGSNGNREKRKKRKSNDMSATTATVESFGNYDGSDNNSNTPYVEYESENSASVTEYSDEDSLSQSLSRAPSRNRRRRRKLDDYDDEGEAEGDGEEGDDAEGEGEISVGEESEFGRSAFEEQERGLENNSNALNASSDSSADRNKYLESKSNTEQKNLGYDSDESQYSHRNAYQKAGIATSEKTSVRKGNVYDNDFAVGIAMGDDSGVGSSDSPVGNDFGAKSDVEQASYYLNMAQAADADLSDEQADSVEMQRAIIFSMQKDDGSTYCSTDGHDMSNINDEDDVQKSYLQDNQRFQRVQEEFDPNAVPRTRDIINSLASQCYILLDTNNSTNIFDSPLRNFCDGYCENATALKFFSPLQTIFMLWESAQIVTSRGFYTLYSFSDRCTVLCQVIQSPSSFLYIIPGLVNGVLDSSAEELSSKDTTAKESVRKSNILLDTILSAVLNENLIGNNSEIDNEDYRNSSVLSWDNIIDLVLFIQKEISERKEAPQSDSEGNRNYVDEYTASSIKMHDLISGSLIKLFYSIASIIFDKVSLATAVVANETPTEHLDVSNPWGDDVDRLLAAIVECIAVDLNTLKNSNYVRNITWIQNSFTAQILQPLISHFIPLDVVRMAVAFPHLLKLLTLFHATYGTSLAVGEAVSPYQTWLEDTFSSVFNLAAAMAHFLLQPQAAAIKLFQNFNLANTGSLISAKYEPQLNGSLLTKCSEQYLIWSYLHRCPIPDIPSYNDFQPHQVKEDVVVQENTTAINPYTGAIHSAILFMDQACSHLLSNRSGVLFSLLKCVLPNFESVEFLKPCFISLLGTSKVVSNEAYNNLNGKLVEISTELRRHLLGLILKSRKPHSNSELERFLVKGNNFVESSGGDFSKISFPALVDDDCMKNFINIWISSYIYSAIIILECDRMQSSNNHKLLLLSKVTENCQDLLTLAYSIEPIPNIIDIGNLSEELIYVSGNFTKMNAEGDLTFQTNALRSSFVDSVIREVYALRQRFECKHPYIFKSQSSFSRLRAAIKSQSFSSTVSKEEFLLGSKSKTFLRSRAIRKSGKRDKDFRVLESLLSLLLLENTTIALATDAAIHIEIDRRSKYQGVALILFTLKQLQNCKTLLQKFAETFVVDIFDKIASDLEFYKYFTNSVETGHDIDIISVIYGKVDRFVTEIIKTLGASSNIFDQSLVLISDLLSLLVVTYALGSRFDQFYRFESPISFQAFLEALHYIFKPSSALSEVETGPREVSVMASHKKMSLLQSLLRNFILIHRVQHNLLDSIRTTFVTVNSDPVAANHSFLQSICGIFVPLGSMLKDQVSSFYKHLSFCKNAGLKYLSSSIKPIELSSPSIIPNVFSPQGCFAIGFWLYIPSNYCVSSAESTTNRKIHILSRIPETGDINLVSLLSDDVASVNHSLSVHLVEEGGAIRIVMNTNVLDSTSTVSNSTLQSSRNKAFKKLELKSNEISRDAWICFIIEVTQEAVGESIPTDPAFADSTSQRKERTCAALFIDGVLTHQSDIEGGRSPLHQNIVIGKIPTRLGEDSGSASGASIISATFNGDSQVRQNSGGSHILVADVFWIPTSIFLASASKEHHRVKSVLRLSVLNNDINPLPTITVSDPPRCSFYDRGVPQCPPTFLLQSIDQLYNCSTKLLDTVSSLFANEVFKKIELHQSSYLLTYLPTILTFSSSVLCVANARTQEAAFHTIRHVLEAIVIIKSSSQNSQLETVVYPAGPAVHVAALQKVLTSARECLQFTMDLVSDILNEGSSKKLDGPTKLAENRMLWLQRIRLCRSSVDKAVRVIEWGCKIAIDANIILTGVAKIMSTIPGAKKSLQSDDWFESLGDLASGKDEDLSLTREKQKIAPGSAILIASAACGGWFPQASVNRTVDLIPRKLFLKSDPRGFDFCLFPSTAIVMHAANTLVRPNNGILLKDCTGAYVFSDNDSGIGENSSEEINFKCLFPQNSQGIISATEITPVIDPFSPMPLILDLADRISVKSANALLELLKLVVSFPGTSISATAVASTVANVPSKKKKANTTLSKGRSLQSLEADAVSPTSQSSVTKGSGSFNTAGLSLSNLDSNSYSMALVQQVSFLRCLLVQVTLIDDIQALNSEGKDVFTVIRKNLRSLISLSTVDPVHAVCNLFQSSSFKGVQLDVLKNLLKEGDIHFLEKISLRLWKQFRYSKEDLGSSVIANVEVDLVNSLVQLTALAGEVAISDTKVRALTHFPSVRLSGVALERMTGRWFYEVTLLSDGLMQVGWANSLFRCDPICGQGVGDHIHSWAFDGLRSKKWNG